MQIFHQVLDGRVAGEECSCGAREDRPIRQGRGYADPNNKALLTPLSLSLHRKCMYRNLCNLNQNGAGGGGDS